MLLLSCRAVVFFFGVHCLPLLFLLLLLHTINTHTVTEFNAPFAARFMSVYFCEGFAVVVVVFTVFAVIACQPTVDLVKICLLFLH